MSETAGGAIRAGRCMAKVFECGSVVPGCESVLHAEDASELMIRAVEHMRSTHEVQHVSGALGDENPLGHQG
jgi:predicted small metal-binding protein